MGLFDKRDKKKRRDDFASPVEEIRLDEDLSSQEAMDVFEDEFDHETEPTQQVHVVSQDMLTETKMDYGIDHAIKLMRTLPADNVELVVQVVKHTLASTQIAIAPIIEDGTKKQKRIEDRIGGLKGEIAALEDEIATRRGEIKRLEDDHAETTTVKERLILAEKLTTERKERPARASAPPPPEPRAKSKTQAPEPAESASTATPDDAAQKSATK